MKGLGGLFLMLLGSQMATAMLDLPRLRSAGFAFSLSLCVLGGLLWLEARLELHHSDGRSKRGTK